MIIDSCWIVDEVNFEMRGALADMNTNMNMATMSPIMCWQGIRIQIVIQIAPVEFKY